MKFSVDVFCKYNTKFKNCLFCCDVMTSSRCRFRSNNLFRIRDSAWRGADRGGGGGGGSVQRVRIEHQGRRPGSHQLFVWQQPISLTAVFHSEKRCFRKHPSSRLGWFPLCFDADSNVLGEFSRLQLYWDVIFLWLWYHDIFDTSWLWNISGEILEKSKMCLAIYIFAAESRTWIVSLSLRFSLSGVVCFYQGYFWLENTFKLIGNFIQFKIAYSFFLNKLFINAWEIVEEHDRIEVLFLDILNRSVLNIFNF